jgi:hypothetical protein
LAAGRLALRSAWAAPDPIRADQDRLYRALDADERERKPLFVTAFVNLTYYGRFYPLDRNMYWNGGYGYAGYFDRHVRDRPGSRRFGQLRFERLSTAIALPEGATVHAFFRVPISPPIFLLCIGYAHGPAGLTAASQAVRHGSLSCPVVVKEGSFDAIRDARLIGFAGHNPAFDQRFGHLMRQPPSNTCCQATFAIGCCTGGTIPYCAPVRVVPALDRPGAVPLLFSDSLMTGEAFSFMAMLTGLVDRLPLPSIVDRANDEYQRVLSRNGGRHGRPFTPLARLYAGRTI